MLNTLLLEILTISETAVVVVGKCERGKGLKYFPFTILTNEKNI